MLPEAREVTLQLKDGTSHTGELVARSPDLITLKIDRGRGIAFQQEFKRTEIKSITEMDIANIIAPRLLALKELLDGTPDEAQLAKAISLLREFTIKAPDHPAAGDVRLLLENAIQQTESLKQGMIKVEGRWLPPVQAAVARIEQHEARMKEMEEKFRGINSTTFPANPAAKNFYDQLAASRREIIQRLPTQLGERLPGLLQQKQFDEAAAELNALHAFYAARIAGVGAQPSRVKLSPVEAGSFADMAMSDFFRMQQRFMDAYGKEPAAATPVVNKEQGFVEIPSGYFILGSTNSSAGAAYPAMLNHVAAFRIDLLDVSNAEYRQFVDYTETTLDQTIQHPDAPPLKDHRPPSWSSATPVDDNESVTGIDWFDAYAYAQWKKKRLPTAAEWERILHHRDLFSGGIQPAPDHPYIADKQDAPRNPSARHGVRLVHRND